MEESVAVEKDLDRFKAHMDPRGPFRIIFHADGHPYGNHMPSDPEEEDLYEYVDHLADSNVDIFSLMSLVSGEAIWQSDYAQPRFSKWSVDSPRRVKMQRLWAKGIEPVAAYAKRCHERGMKFLAKFRMNDRHSRGKLSGHFNIHMGSFIQDHPEWWLKTFPGGLDFTHQGVRDWFVDLATEVTAKFDIDGLTFNYMRYPYVFQPDQSREKQPILTAFMRRVRTMLDQEGQKKGKRLLFCVVVPVTVEECHNLGCDVPQWSEQGIVDIVCPCDYDSTVPNAPYDEFAELTRERNVYLFPALHAHVSRMLSIRNLMSLPSCRAVARNFYAAGADGVSAFNYMYHWATMASVAYPGPMEQFPKALHYFRELRSLDTLQREDRHYVTWPIQAFPTLPGLFDRSRPLTLKRAQGARAERPIRCAEEFDGSSRALVRLNAVNLVPGDRIELTVNGEVVPEDSVTRVFHEHGRRQVEKGMDLGAYTSISFVPTTPPFAFLHNTIGLTLLESAPEAHGDITVPEIEIAVAVGDRSPLDVMSLIEEHHPAPVQSLAGYHPAPNQAFLHTDAAGTWEQSIGAPQRVEGAECVSKGAQSFALQSAAQISRVELCFYRSPDVCRPVALSLRPDDGGKPGERPVNANAVAVFNPWDNPEGLSVSLQGYYTFIFDRPLALDPGAYWLVFEMDPSGQPASSTKYGDPRPSCYGPLLAVNACERYPHGHYMTWEAHRWRAVEKNGRPVSAFFGVFREDGDK